MNVVRPVTALLMILFAGSSFTIGQTTVRGSVTDSLTREALVGANVYLPGTALGAVTDREGRFIITHIPAGSHTLRASYLGYRTSDVHIEASGEELTLSFVLVPDVLEGEEVVVTGQMRGQVAAINQQLSANTMISVVSEEKIKELPDANAAEAVGRLPGVSVIRSGGEANRVVLRGLSDKYSTVTIDGIKIPPTDADSRGVDLSTTSQGSLSGIELYKALTPDKDADAIAGSVNLVTRKAPVERLIRVDAKGDYNRLMQSYDQYDFAVRYGERFFSDILGVQAMGNLERRNRSNERINVDYNTAREYEINDFIVEFTDEIRSRNGAGLLLDVNTPDDGSIRMNNIYSSTKRKYLFSTRNYPYGTGRLLSYAARDREQDIKTFTSSLRGENSLLGLGITWGLSFGQSWSEYPFDYAIDFIEPSIEQDSVQISGMRNDTPALHGHPELLIPYALNNFAVAYLNNAYYRFEKNFDRERTAYFDLSREYALDRGLSGKFQVGAKHRYKNRFKESSQQYAPYYLGYWRDHTRLPDGSIVPKNFNGTWFETFYQRFLQTSGGARNPFAVDFLNRDPGVRNLFDRYKLSPIVNKDALRLWYQLNKNGVDDLGRSGEYYNDPSVSADYYDIVERVYAAYVMNTLNVGQDITVIAGLRMEREQNDYGSKFSPFGLGGFPIPFGAIRDTVAHHDETFWLPSFHITYRPTDFLNVRLAAFRAIARPDFNLRLEKFVSRGGGGDVFLLLGNPGLKSANAWNYEVNTSFFHGSFGLISLSAFYKEIHELQHVLTGAYTIGNSLIDMFGITWRTPHTGSYALTVPYNSFKPTKVWGFEFEHQMNFNSFPGLLKNIVLSYNASIVRSETYLVSTDTVTVLTKVYVPGFDTILVPMTSNYVKETRQKLEEQPEFYGNISLGYDFGGFSARLSLFHQAQYNLSFSASGTNDQVIDAFTRLDLALRHRITENISVMLHINNLTNAEESNSIINRSSGTTYLNTSELYGLTADLGVRLEW